MEFAGEAATAQDAVRGVERAGRGRARRADAAHRRVRGGRDAAGRRPGLPILLCSAIVDDEIRERAAAAGIAACLSKDHFEAIPRVVVELADGRR